DGEQSRDFTFVKNVVDANLLACGNGMEEFSGEVFNVASGKRITINNLIENINKLTKFDVKPKYESPRPGDVKHSLANIGKARQFLNYEPTVDFYGGLERLVGG
ncbi:MAG: GDP-mannose 4,6-dehydratase, partial [Candidatus Lokiarchaeota archaeon]|nr:GDP-mannose 4,6-dehydratase [Candidatus Lokiarchaeota archaeon]